MISEALFPNLSKDDLPYAKLSDYLGKVNNFPCLKVYIKCKWYKGFIDAIIDPIKFCTVLLGNIPGAKFPGVEESAMVNENPAPKRKTHTAKAVTTRGMAREVVHPLVLPEVEPLNISHEGLQRLQKDCKTLQNVRDNCSKGEVLTQHNTSYEYIKENGLLYKSILQYNIQASIGKKLLVIPFELRKVVLKLAHDIPVAGHFSHRKILKKIRELYFWPGMTIDVYSYCRSCDVCQRNSCKGRIKKAPLIKMPIITTPFSRVAIDFVGSINPSSSAGYRFILTLIDYATGFPEAIPLKNTTSIDVSEALMTVFSRDWHPKGNSF